MGTVWKSVFMRILFTISLLAGCFFGNAQILTHGIVQSGSSTPGCTDADALKYFAATGITDATKKMAICDFITREKAASRWGTEVQVFYILGNGSYDASKYNLIDTGTFKYSEFGTITYTTGSGGGAKPTSGSYLLTGYTPSVDATSANSFHYMLWSLENINETSTDMGCHVGYIADIELYNTTMYTVLNTSTYGSYLTSGLSTTVGCFLSNRTSSTAVAVYQNGSSLTSGSITANGLPTGQTLIFTSNQSNFSTKKCVFASIGAGISNPSDYYNSVNQLKTDLGL